MTDEQLCNRLGLRAAGDQLTLRRFCDESLTSSNDKSSSERKIRKKQLLDLIRSGSVKSSRLHHMAPSRVGRPKQKGRVVNLGLRVLERKSNKCAAVINVKAPLGDSNNIKIFSPWTLDMKIF